MTVSFKNQFTSSSNTFATTRSERMDGMSRVSSTRLLFQKLILKAGVQTRIWSLTESHPTASNTESLEIPQAANSSAIINWSWHADNGHFDHAISMFTKARGATVIILTHHSHSISKTEKIQSKVGVKPPIFLIQTESKRRAEWVKDIFRANCKGYISDPWTKRIYRI